MSYPSSLDNLSHVSSGQTITAGIENSQMDALNAVETALGTNPFGIYGTVAAAITARQAARIATTAALASYTVNGNVLTASANGALSVDGVSLAVNDRVLVKNETGANQPNNGMYGVTQTGDASNPWVLTRAADMNVSGVVEGSYVYVREGTAQSGTLWCNTNTGAFTLGTTAMTWAQLAGPPQSAFSMNTQNVTNVTDPVNAQDAATKHYVDSTSAALVPTGTVLPFAGITTPSGFLLCDGSSVSRSTYAGLYAALSTNKGTVTITIASPCVVTLNNHGLSTGDCIFLETTGALPTGLSADTNYYVIKIDTTTFKLATSYANALASTAINTSGSQSGTHTLYRAPYGIADSTHFNVPDLRGRAAIGSGTSSATGATAHALGSTPTSGVGGEETHTLGTTEIPSHNHGITEPNGGVGHLHSISDPTHRHIEYDCDGDAMGTASGSSLNRFAVTQTASASYAQGGWNGTGITINNSVTGISINNTGGGGGHNTMSPFCTLNYIIKT